MRTAQTEKKRSGRIEEFGTSQAGWNWRYGSPAGSLFPGALAAFFVRRAIPRGTLEPAKLRVQDILVNSGVPHRVQSATAVRRVDYRLVAAMRAPKSARNDHFIFPSHTRVSVF